MKHFFLSLCLGLFTITLVSQEKEKKESAPISQLSFRSIGPAFASGRIADFAVNPTNFNEYYVAVASGHIWKTVNNGTTFEPVFDSQEVYSIGCLALDPKNTNVIWAGTGENNHQRSVSYGNGIYKSVDGGKSWKNIGLKESRHIGQIAIDPQYSEVVYVAAEGSLWGSGGERGLYKTTNGGTTWDKILTISEHTGVNNVVIDPVNPDVVYATSEQRRRHVNIRIGGGPETALWKSTDAGKTWRKLTNGIPDVDKAGMGIVITPRNNNILYMMIEAAEGKGGFFRSKDQGESWEKMSDYNTSAQYYGEIFCHPTDVNTLFAMETVSKYTTDGGKTWKNIGLKERHVDDHAFWMNPNNENHFMIGGDGGIYETFDFGENFIHKTNLPVTQFYRVNVDNDYPFYNVYGGTQDNNSFGGPSQSLYNDGVVSSDWTITLGGDGFWQAIDPENPDIVYSEYQYGNIFRFDKKSGERLPIKPMPKADEPTYKWHWDTPFILSQHHSNRLYIAADKLFRSDDRGESWTRISEDLTQNIPRDQWKVMDKYWSVDAVSKNVSTSPWGTAVALAESPVNQNLLFVGTDDGTLNVTENGGQSWTKTTSFSGVPNNSYITDILPSKFDENVVYITLENHMHDDFTPYVLMSNNKGKSWQSISNNLPKNHYVHTIEQDFLDKNLLFVGTEFGVFYSKNAGTEWTALKNGMPSIAVKDIVIQKREHDLVLATFGRGFYILDNYKPLREWNSQLKDQKAHIFEIENALLYIQKDRGMSYGSMPYVAKNPDFGATFTYYIKDGFTSKKDSRQEKEKEWNKTNSPIPIPTAKELFVEENEPQPYLLFTIADLQGNEITKFTDKYKKGVHRVNWDLKYRWANPVQSDKFEPIKLKNRGGIFVMPGTYQVRLDVAYADRIENLVPFQQFEVVKLQNTTLPAENIQEVADFQKKLKELSRVAFGSVALHKELYQKVNTLKTLSLQTQNIPNSLMAQLNTLSQELLHMQWQLEGETPKASYEEINPAPMAILPRLEEVLYVHTQSTGNITKVQKDGYQILRNQLQTIIEKLNQWQRVTLPQIEEQFNNLGAPYTKGRTLEFKD